MKYSKLSDYQIKKILRNFSLELTAIQTARQMNLNRHTVDRYYEFFRERIARYQEHSVMHGASASTPARIVREPDARWSGLPRNSIGDTPVIGLVKREGKVFVTLIPDVSSKFLLPIVKKLDVNALSSALAEHWTQYDGLVLSHYRHYRIPHGENSAHGHHTIDDVDSFWSQVKRKMRKHNGIPRHKLYLYLKESEFRFNNREKNLYPLLASIIFHA